MQDAKTVFLCQRQFLMMSRIIFNFAQYFSLGQFVDLKLEVCTEKINFVHLRSTRLMLIKTKLNFPNYKYFEDVNRE